MCFEIFRHIAARSRSCLEDARHSEYRSLTLPRRRPSHPSHADTTARHVARSATETPCSRNNPSHVRVAVRMNGIMTRAPHATAHGHTAATCPSCHVNTIVSREQDSHTVFMTRKRANASLQQRQRTAQPSSTFKYNFYSPSFGVCLQAFVIRRNAV